MNNYIIRGVSRARDVCYRYGDHKENRSREWNQMHNKFMK